MLREKLEADLVTAMKSRDTEKLSVLRMVKSALTVKEKASTKQLDDSDTIAVLNTMVKQRKESCDAFKKGNRLDLVTIETREIEILHSYLPIEATLAELQQAVYGAITSIGAASIKDMGNVMKAARSLLEGKTIDGKVLSELIKESLIVNN